MQIFSAFLFSDLTLAYPDECRTLNVTFSCLLLEPFKFIQYVDIFSRLLVFVNTGCSSNTGCSTEHDDLKTTDYYI